MGIPINSICYHCLLTKHIETARSLGDEQTATAFSKALLNLVANAEPEADSAVLGARINTLYQQFYGLDPDRYREEKQRSNTFVLERLDTIRARVQSAQDPVYAALQYAILGNYIDFSALGKNVSFSELDQMLDTAQDIAVDRAVYADFCRDLETGNSLLYLCDNAGELGFDRILGEQIHARYPHVAITFCVRGLPVHNDATQEDAALMQIPFPVIDNGCAIGGTPLGYIGSEAKQALEKAHVVLAKGMGNTETMIGCGYHVYYAFLIKCPRFRQFFDKPQLTPMFIKERT